MKKSANSFGKKIEAQGQQKVVLWTNEEEWMASSKQRSDLKITNLENRKVKK